MQRRRNRAGVARHGGANTVVDAVANAVADHRVMQPPTERTSRRRFDLDRAGYKSRRTETLEIHVAREVVTARPQRCERRRQPRLERHKTANRRREAALDRYTHALGDRLVLDAVELVDPHDVMRSLRSRSSRASTKPVIAAPNTARSSTGCAM